VHGVFTDKVETQAITLGDDLLQNLVTGMGGDVP
jgi:hypothetical protein